VELTSAVVNEGPVRQVAVASVLRRITAVNGPRMSVISGCQSADAAGATPARREVHSLRALAVCPLAGRVGDAVQPANAFGAPAPARTTRTSAAIAPAAASAPMPPSASRRDRRLRSGADVRPRKRRRCSDARVSLLGATMGDAAARRRTSPQSESSGA
jgi:hypothetical protein